MTTLSTRSILVLTSNYGTETDEIRRPIQDLRAAGAQVTVTAPDEGAVATLVLDREAGPEIPVDTTYHSVRAADYDALILPGGTINADTLRADQDALALVRAFAEQGKPIAAICHAPWVLIDADLVEGRDLTSVPTIATDLVNAGAFWADRELVVDDAGGFRLLTSRTPEDLDVFTGAVIDALA